MRKNVLVIEKNCDREKLLKFEAEGREFSKNFIDHSLEHFFLTVGQNNFDNKIPLLAMAQSI